MTKIIKLRDGLQVEVEVDENQVLEISDSTAISTSMENLKILLSKVMSPVANVYKELSKDVVLESTKVTVGVKVGVEGNFILAKSTVGANIQVEMTLRESNE